MAKVTAWLLILALLLGGCARADERGQTFSYDLPGYIDSLDPQFAQGAGSRLIIYNCFEGLLRLDETGEPVPGAGEYTISMGGLCYEFEINEGALWSDGSPVLADDFLFSFERIFSPSTPSPYVEDFMSLRGAAEVLSGERPLSYLGVSVTGERRISFYLSELNAAFPLLLTTAAAMPCKRDFFAEQRGRYGLERDKLLTTGPFKLTRWDSRRVILERQEDALNPALPDKVTLFLGESDREGRFGSAQTDFWLSSGEYSLNQGYKAESFYDKTYLLAFNQNVPPFDDMDVRTALVSALNREAVEQAIGGSRLPAGAVLPPAAQLFGRGYRDLGGEPVLPVAHSDPRDLLFSAFERLEISSLPDISLLLLEGSDMALGSLMQRQWQQRLSAYIDIEPVSGDSLSARVQQGRYQIAILPAITGNAGSPSAVLWALGGHSGGGVLGAELPELEALLYDAQAAADPVRAAGLYKKAEQLLMDTFSLWPIYYSATDFISAPGVSGGVYLPQTGVLYFAGARRG